MTIKRIFVGLLIILFPKFLFGVELFSWNVEDANSTYGASNYTALSGDGSNSKFNTINLFGHGVTQYTTDIARDSWAIRVTYETDTGEDGGLLELDFGANDTRTLYLRWYEYFSTSIDNDVPQCFKIGRWFNDVSGYTSLKFCIKTADCATADELRVIRPTTYGCEFSYELDVSDRLAGGQWHKIEFYLDIGTNSPDVSTGGSDYCADSTCSNNLCGDASCNGLMQIWINDTKVFDYDNVCFRNTSTAPTQYTGGWFGGNDTYGTCGRPSEQVIRYLDDFYASTVLDREQSSDTADAIEGLKVQ
jgi:hypothetical protein